MLKQLLKLPGEIYHNRKLIWRLAKNDFKTRYAGSYLGKVWAMVQPVVTVLVYWFVFEKGLSSGAVVARTGITVPFVLWLTSGLVPWFYFSEALSNGTNSLLEYNYLVKKVVFNIDILPLVKIISSVFIHAFFILFLLLLMCCYGMFPDVYTLQILYYSICLIVFTLGLCYLTSALIVFFRDLSQIISIVLQIGIWMTPIMWTLDRLDAYPALQFVFKLNPLYYIVYGYRDALFQKVFFWEHPFLTGYFWILTVVLFGTGLVVFRRLKVHFADVL